MTAALRWIDEQSDVVEDDDGEMVHAAVTVDLDIDSVVTIRRIDSNADRPQGLALDADVPIGVNGVESTRIVLWDHSSPDEVDLEVPAGRLTLWNVWETDGAVHAWVGAAGIVLDEVDTDITRLRASDGIGHRTVDLEVEVRIRAS
ncbi:MAG: hypothetical protein AAF081_17090 [Actinomycetota bacterium]